MPLCPFGLFSNSWLKIGKKVNKLGKKNLQNIKKVKKYITTIGNVLQFYIALSEIKYK